MATLPTGEQYEINGGGYDAVITEVGAMCRSLRAHGTELLWSFGAEGAPSLSQSAQLLPWPNRIADGRYSFDGEDFQLPLTEPSRHNALHGLNRGQAWHLVDHTSSSVRQRTTFYPQDGWPGTLTAEISHSLASDGLTVEVHVRNDGGRDLPYGYGCHPYLVFSDLSQVTMTLPFSQELIVTPDRLLPVSLEEVTAEHDFRAGRLIGSTQLDTAFTGAAQEEWSVVLRDAERHVQVWGTASTPWLQVYTGDNALAVEPMTCGPDAFNEGPTHEGMVVLRPGEEHQTRWGIRVAERD